MPARVRDLKRALEQHGILYENPPGGGSHGRFTDGRTVYPVPARNGLKTEVGDVYIRGVCRCFGLDLAELKNAL